ncbi:MAG: response regulator [Acidobacteria bacterium]|nr:response regulator [Acidobacteriota bacterium]
MNILVADDDKVHVHLLTTLLKKRGYCVTVAYDGLQAWSTALRSKPDAIILDIHMPAGTGFEVLRKLKTSTKTSQIPVIVVSGVRAERPDANIGGDARRWIARVC